MIEWLPGLPQTDGWYLWFDIPDPFCSVSDVVHIGKASVRKPEDIAEMREKNSVYFYFNDAGEELIIYWGLVPKPGLFEGKPDADWAPFNFPEVTRIRKIVPKACGVARL